MSGEDEFVETGNDPFDQQGQAEAERQLFERQQDQVNVAYALIQRRQEAYRRVFLHGEPTQGDRDLVLADLAAFTRAHQSRFHVNHAVHSVMEGRAEVYYRILDHAGLSADAAFVKYTEGQSKR